MLRTLLLLVFVTVLPLGPAAQERTGVLRITLAITGAAGTVSPPHALLVSEEPPSRAPRMVRTGPDGTATVQLAPGRYLVESDEPVHLGGAAYAWRQEVEITAGRETLLELTTSNADVTPLDSASGATPDAARDDPSVSLARWHDSVFAVWTPTHRRSGFLADPRGLVVTNGRAVGTATSVEVQVTPTTKLAARVLLADPTRDVAVIWIDPKAIATTPPVPLACDGPGTARLAEDQKVYALGAAAGTGRTFAPGTVREIAGRVVETDFILTASAAGGPVFGADGRVIGISSFGEDENDGRDSADTRLTRVEELCAALSAAAGAMSTTTVPDPNRLPMEPERPYPPDALRDAAAKVAGVDAYRFSSSSYDITFITPPMLYAASRRPTPQREPGRTGGAVPDPRTIDPLDDFSNWSSYVERIPPVLMVRVTPRLVEGFWTRVARGAARTQGMSLPPIKRFKPGFARLQAFCGDAEVTPIHPFKLVQRVSESEAIYEGLYVFAPEALGPSCGSVRLVLYSETDGKGNARVVNPEIVQRIRDDFAPYRPTGG
jgi:S1-C subfamily serine protease